MSELERFAALAVLVSLVGCADEMPRDDVGDLAFPLVEVGSPEEAGLLAFVNAASTTAALLDDEVKLDARAANNIVRERDGADRIPGTPDDRAYLSVAELDAVPYVGPTALERMLAYARDHGWIAAGAVGRESAILALVNARETTAAVLDLEVRLDRRAAVNIVARRDGPDAIHGTSDDRPFTSLAEVDAIAYVGAAALDALAAYALDHGYGGEAASGPGCALISEVVEGSGNYNKAVEIYNCGSGPLALESVGLCLVRNDDTRCTLSARVGTGMLPPGETWVVCRSKASAPSDPFPALVAACDHEIGMVASFNGDDRLVLFADPDGDGQLGDGALHDVFGDIASRPDGTPWSDAAFRRCDLAPHTAGRFDLAGSFLVTRLGQGSVYDHLGVPPDDSCGDAPLAGAGDDCLDHASCEEGLRCYGRPADRSTHYGKCVDPAPVPGEGARCDRTLSCADGLICAGWTLWGEGQCVPQWMAGRFETHGSAPIADPPSGGIAPGVIIYGLASVPVDLEVVVHVEHPRPEDLRVTLIDPNGAEAVLWDRTSELQAWSRSFVTSGGISRDDKVNGRWHLRVQDLVAGQTGTFEQWSLFVVSRWD